MTGRLARQGQRLGAALDQLDQALGKAAAAVADGAALAGEIGGERGEVQHRLARLGADPGPRRSLAIGHQAHGSRLLQQHDQDACRLLGFVRRVVDVTA